MREVHHGRRAVLLAAVAVLTFSGQSGQVAAADGPNDISAIPGCPARPDGRLQPPGDRQPHTGPTRTRAASPAWQTTLDASGTVRGHTLRVDASTWRAGPRAFADGPFQGTLVTGERSAAGTRVRLIDLARRCTARSISLGALVYGSLVLDDGTLVVSLVDRQTRAELGVWQIGRGATAPPRRLIAPPSGPETSAIPRGVTLRVSSLGVLARWCGAGSCITRGSSRLATGLAAEVDLDPDADLDGAGSLPLRSPRPVPVYDRWFPWAVLSFRFHTTDVSPGWMKNAIEAAADGATDTSRSLSPIFAPVDGSAKGVIRYTSSFSSNCANAIACASHDADAWTLRMRPHGHDFRWGELRWCQKTNSDGCFDAERVAIHEFGHIVGLDHPETAGFRLAPSTTVMHQVSPSRPHAAWDRDSFGACDVASLQEQYGTPTMSTSISTCNDVDTRISLSASATQVAAAGRLVLTADLRTRADRAEYGEVSGMRLNGRSVQLRRRPAGSNGAWTTSWMRWAESPGIYTITLYPRSTYEYVAVFSAPDDEGLHGSTSNESTVRVTAACTGTCPNEEDPS